MASARPAATRRSILACTLVVATALTLGACGGEGDATAGSAPPAGSAGTTAATPPTADPRTAPGCPAKVDSLLAALNRLRRQLAAGLSYDQYAAAVRALRGDYATIPVEHLAIGCLRTTGTPAERALNRYIDGANAWGECLADAACSTATIEPVLQRKWRVASHFLSEAGPPSGANPARER